MDVYQLGMDKVRMTPHICIDFWAKSSQGRIQGRAIIGKWGPFSKGLLLKSLKATATNRMCSNDQLEPQGALIAHLSTMSASVIS